jgi:hypothetical protein
LNSSSECIGSQSWKETSMKYLLGALFVLIAGAIIAT